MIPEAARGRHMKRYWLVPALGAALLSGCITTDYGYRDNGYGDYYYGRSYGTYSGGVGYGYPGGVYGYGSYRYGSPSGYYGGVYSGYPYRYGYYGGYRYGYPYNGYYNRPPVVIVQPPRRHDRDHHDHRDRDRDRDRKPPWRDLDGLRGNNVMPRPPAGVRITPQVQQRVQLPSSRPNAAGVPVQRSVQQPARPAVDNRVRERASVRPRTENAPSRTPERERRQRLEP